MLTSKDIIQQLMRFATKYSCVPGDCANSTTFFPDLIGNSFIVGNGNGIIDDNMSYNPKVTGFPASVNNEPTAFWIELWDAGLTTCCNPANIVWGTNYTIGSAFPQDRVNGGAIAVGNLGTRNGFFWGITNSCISPGCSAAGSTTFDYVGLSNPITSFVLTPAQGRCSTPRLMMITRHGQCLFGLGLWGRQPCPPSTISYWTIVRH